MHIEHRSFKIKRLIWPLTGPPKLSAAYKKPDACIREVYGLVGATIIKSYM